MFPFITAADLIKLLRAHPSQPDFFETTCVFTYVITLEFALPLRGYISKTKNENERIMMVEMITARSSEDESAYKQKIRKIQSGS